MGVSLALMINQNQKWRDKLILATMVMKEIKKDG